MKHEKLSKYKNVTMNFLQNFNSYSIDNVPQKDNHHANVMASAASLISPQDHSKDYTFFVYMVMKILIEDEMREVLSMKTNESSEWYTLILNYVKYDTFPKSST
jgi:hypothetical protein